MAATVVGVGMGFSAAPGAEAGPNAGADQPCPVVPLIGADCPTLPTNPDPPPLPPVPGDGDGDRIVDSYEDHLLEKFAPRIWLRADEDALPVNADWLLARSTLRFGHPRCSDDQVLPFGAVTSANITQQWHRSKHDALHIPPWDACEHFGDEHHSHGYQGDIKESFFLQFHDGDHRGSTDRQDWVLYGHVSPASSGRYVVQYWQLYAYNNSLATINHEGDWEHSAVIVDAAEEPQQLVYFRHGHTRTVDADDAEWYGNHHVTYSAKGSHSQYRGREADGGCDADSIPDDAQGLADHCSQGIAWNSWQPSFGGVVNVGEKAHPLNGANWLRYSGLWGEVGLMADVVTYTSGPRGPAYQSAAWNWKPGPAPTPPPSTTTTTVRPTTTTTRPATTTTRPSTTTTTRRPTTTTRPCPPQAPNCEEP
jgi:hypothetical protein